MGQLVGTNSNIFRCNLVAIQGTGTEASTVLAAGEVWLVDSTNSLTSVGSGVCDCYIKGNGTDPATALPLNDNTGLFDISNIVINDFVSGKYLRASSVGETAWIDSAATCSYSNPVEVKVGDEVHCKHQGTQIACICTTNATGSTYTAVAISSNSSGIVESTYIVEEDGYIAVSSRTAALDAWVVRKVEKYLPSNSVVSDMIEGSEAPISSGAVKSASDSLSHRIDEVAQLAANGGYRYMADTYGILSSNSDNTDALQALVDQVNYEGGGIIELPKGTFNIAGQIRWASNVGIVGQGQNVTIIKNTCTSGSIQGTFYGDYVDNITFKDFTIDATESTTGKGLFMRYIQDGVFENLRIVGTIPTGLGIDFIDRVKIVNCNIYGCGRGRWTAIPSGVGCSGIGIGTGWANHQENFIISNCICDGCYNNGIFVEDQGRFGGTVMADGTGQIIANCICRNGRNCGFSVWGGKDVSFIGNLSYNNNSAGFEIGFYGQNILFEGNQSIHNGQGFKISGITKPSIDIAFLNNVVKENTTAVTIATGDNTNGITIKGNVIKNNTNGISISGNSSVLIVENNNSSGTTNADYTIGGTHTDAVIKNNTYFNGVTNTAIFDGNSQWVEQFISQYFSE